MTSCGSAIGTTWLVVGFIFVFGFIFAAGESGSFVEPLFVLVPIVVLPGVALTIAYLLGAWC